MTETGQRGPRAGSGQGLEGLRVGLRCRRTETVIGVC